MARAGTGGKRQARYGEERKGGDLGFEATLWQTADTLRGNMDPGEYKHVVLGLIFLKYVSDAFSERHEKLECAVSDPARPLMASLTVPSPPKATTTSKPSCAASRLNAWKMPASQSISVP